MGWEMLPGGEPVPRVPTARHLSRGVLSHLAGGRPQVGEDLAAVHASLKEVAAAHLRAGEGRAG